MSKEFISLKKNYEFMRVYKNGQFYVGKYMILHAAENKRGNLRLGISVSKKVGKSVQRSRIKRLIKENFRTNFAKDVKKQDLVFVARKDSVDASFYDIKHEMKFLLKKLDLYEENN